MYYYDSDHTYLYCLYHYRSVVRDVAASKGYDEFNNKCVRGHGKNNDELNTIGNEIHLMTEPEINARFELN